ncbi:M23 family metallopeptidase [bacterium]|nr:M23 family metallopeptidase [bacterium]
MPFKRSISVLIVPHDGGETKPVSVPRWALITIICLFFAVLIGLGSTAIYYASRYEEVSERIDPLEERGDFLARKNGEYKTSAMVSNSELSALTNAAERDRQAYENSLRAVRLQLTQLQNFYKNLRIMAGFKLEAEAADAVLGSGGPEGEAVVEVETTDEQELEAITTFGLSFANHSAQEYASAEASLLTDMAGLSSEMYLLLRDLEQRISTISPDVPFGVPVQGVITSYFGEPRWHGPHKGLDIAAPIGTFITTPADGIVIESGYRGAYGLTVWIDHGNGYETRYAHMGTATFSVGERVNAGQMIGTIGVTGATTGPHLHYEVRLNNVALDPLNYLVQ